MWEVVSTKEFDEWYFKNGNLNDSERKIIASDIRLIEEFGFSLGRPYVDTLKGSKLNNLKELRTKLSNKVIRIFFIFDPKRRAILLIGGDKKNDKKFYQTMLTKATKIYNEFLKGEFYNEIKKKIQ